MRVMQRAVLLIGEVSLLQDINYLFPVATDDLLLIFNLPTPLFQQLYRAREVLRWWQSFQKCGVYYLRQDRSDHLL